METFAIALTAGVALVGLGWIFSILKGKKTSAAVMRCIVVAVVTILLVFFVSVAFAAEKEEANSAFEISVSADYLSKYVGGLSGSECYDGAVIQPSFTISHKSSGLYFNAWNSTPLNNQGKESEEVDLTVGWNSDVGPLNLDVYYAFYDMHSLGQWKDGDIHAVGFKVKWSGEMFTPYIWVEHDRTIGVESGLFYRTGLEMDLHEHVKANISIAGHDGTDSYRSEAVSSGRITVAFPFEWKGIMIAPEVNFQKRLGHAIAEPDEEELGGITKDNFWYGIRLSFTF